MRDLPQGGRVQTQSVDSLAVLRLLCFSEVSRAVTEAQCQSHVLIKSCQSNASKSQHSRHRDTREDLSKKVEFFARRRTSRTIVWDQQVNVTCLACSSRFACREKPCCDVLQGSARDKNERPFLV